MAYLDIVLTWVHVLGVVVFLGAMFLGTFVLMPVVKANLDHPTRHKFVVHFIPKVRKFVRVFVALIVVTGVSRALLLHYTHEGPASIERLGVFGLKVLFAAVPILIFIAAPRVLGKFSEEGLCCDPDGEGPPAYILGVMTNRGAILHYAAISAGWLAVLLGIVLSQMR